MKRQSKDNLLQLATVGRQEVRADVLLQRLVLLCGAAAAVALIRGFAEPPAPALVLRALAVGLVGLYAADYFTGLRFGRYTIRDQVRTRPQTLLCVAAGLGLLDGLAGGVVLPKWALFDAAACLLATILVSQANIAMTRWLHRPGLLLPFSFLTLIAVGTLLIKLPLAVAPGRELSWVDALFTMTSAVCVTGLVVVDTGSHFSPLGLAVIALFIQLGGLGILIFGTVVALLLGSRLSLRDNASLASMLSDQPIRRIQAMVKFIVVATLGIELVGALLLMPMWDGDMAWSERFGQSLFHSISAFCNAGFALQVDSLVPYRFSPGVHLVILPLIVVGGIGFPVLFDLTQWTRAKLHARRQRSAIRAGLTPVNVQAARLSLSTRLALLATVVLVVGGAASLFAAELIAATREPTQTYNQPLQPTVDAAFVSRTAVDAVFMSVTARTAGFNTLPLDDLGPSGAFMLMPLMLVGGSPGGTAGGFKTTTAVVLFLSVIATMRRRTNTEAFKRTITDSNVRKAGTLVFCYGAVVVAATYILCITESQVQMHRLLFEVVSAATTTGLSLGITDGLTAFGKQVIIVVMFLGRVGPLTLLGALTLGQLAGGHYAYAEEEVMVG